MRRYKIGAVGLLVISLVLLMFTNTVTYMMLLSKNEEWKKALTEKDVNGSDAQVMANALGEHVYYDGDSILGSQTVRHYSRSGKLMETKDVGQLLSGDKVVLLLSPNCCSSCAREEISRLQKLSDRIGHERVVMIADFALHSRRAWTVCFDKDGYYETDVEHLGLKGSPTRETPVVMLTNNGRVKTSFVVGQQTSSYTDSFHDFIVDYFKEAR